ncbi:hypothetical protein ACIHCQ_31035 [Streptomyces sp. NPDC052236]|uniref:hypothetical protein n=1 Tax=Streptomyces sp. NPDC052236 TaxID=3365686 RepID=UPI0037D467AC
MARGNPNRLLAGLLDEAGWNTGELVRAVVALGSAQGISVSYDRTAPAHWLNGARPRPPVPALVAEAFSQRLRRVVTAAETGLVDVERVPEQRRREPVKGAGVELVSELVELCRAMLDPEEGPRLAAGPYESQAARPVALWTPPVRRGVREAGARAGAVVLHDLARTFASLGVRNGGAQIRPLLAAYLAHGVRPEWVRGERELIAGYAQLANLLGVSAMDSGHPRSAQRAFALALGLARAGGSREVWAITSRTMSAQAYELGYVDEAQELAGEAAQEVQGLGAARAFVVVHQAVMEAQGGGDAVALMAEAERAWESSPAPSVGSVGPFTAYPRSALDFQRFRVCRALGEREKALSALRAAARHRPAAQRRPYALLHAQLGEELLGLGMVSAACGAWSTFVDQYPLVWSARADAALVRMCELLAPWSDQSRVRALLERGHGLRGWSPGLRR